LAEDSECGARFCLVQEFLVRQRPWTLSGGDFRDVEAALMFMYVAFGMSISDE